MTKQDSTILKTQTHQLCTYIQTRSWNRRNTLREVKCTANKNNIQSASHQVAATTSRSHRSTIHRTEDKTIKHPLKPQKINTNQEPHWAPVNSNKNTVTARSFDSQPFFRCPNYVVLPRHLQRPLEYQREQATSEPSLICPINAVPL